MPGNLVHFHTYFCVQVGALSPESLRKRSEMLLAEKAAKCGQLETGSGSQVVSPSKKKKSTFSPGGSPSSNPGGSNGPKRSKIVQESEEEEKAATTPLTIPLSPSIKFMDESAESTTKLNIVEGIF